MSLIVDERLVEELSGIGHKYLNIVLTEYIELYSNTIMYSIWWYKYTSFLWAQMIYLLVIYLHPQMILSYMPQNNTQRSISHVWSSRFMCLGMYLIVCRQPRRHTIVQVVCSTCGILDTYRHQLSNHWACPKVLVQQQRPAPLGSILRWWWRYFCGWGVMLLGTP